MVFNLAKVDEIIGSMGMSKEVTGYAIKAMSEEKKLEAQNAWQEGTTG